MSKSNWYFNIQKQVSKLMSISLKEVLNNTDDNTRDLITPLIKRKIDKGTNMRPLLFFIGYCISKNKVLDIKKLSNKDKEIISKITACLELENVSTYYINHYLDNKGDINNEQDAKNRVLAGLLCRDLSHKIIAESKIFNEEQKRIITDTINNIDYDISYAQSMDINKLLFENISKYKDEKHYLEEYFKRCRLISGQFYGRCVELGIKAGKEQYDKKLCEDIANLYTYMSTLGQFGNDIGDFAPPEMHSGTLEKNYYKDYGSDFINGRLTYPNYLLLSRADKKDLRLLMNIKKLGFSKSRITDLLKLLKKYNIIADSLLLLKHEFRKEKKNLTLKEGDLRTLVSSSLIIFKSNKLIMSIRDKTK